MTSALRHKAPKSALALEARAINFLASTRQMHQNGISEERKGEVTISLLSWHLNYALSEGTSVYRDIEKAVESFYSSPKLLGRAMTRALGRKTPESALAIEALGMNCVPSTKQMHTNKILEEKRSNHLAPRWIP